MKNVNRCWKVHSYFSDNLDFLKQVYEYPRVVEVEDANVFPPNITEFERNHFFFPKLGKNSLINQFHIKSKERFTKSPLVHWKFRNWTMNVDVGDRIMGNGVSDTGKSRAVNSLCFSISIRMICYYASCNNEACRECEFSLGVSQLVE